MDISSIASIITEVLQQHLAQHPQASASSAGQGQQSGMVQNLYALVKNKLGGHPESAKTMQAFEQAPEQHAGALQGALTQHLGSDPGFLAQVTDHLRQIKPEATGGVAQGSLSEKAEGMVSDLFGGKKDEPGEKAA